MLKRILVVIALGTVLFIAYLMAGTLQKYILNTDALKEASGLASSIINAGILYSHNDSGGENIVYAIDTKGRLKAMLLISGHKNRDWEEISTCRDPKDHKAYIYIGDIGDNRAKQESVRIIRVPEPAITLRDSLYTLTRSEVYEIAYEDGARDAEAFIVDPKSGDIYIISKREEQVGIYRVSYPQSTIDINLAKKVGQMKLSWVTAADISPNGKYILVKNYLGIRRYKINRKRDIVQALIKDGKQMSYQIEPQGEALCWDFRGKGYYTLSEAATDSKQILYYYK